MNAPLTSELAQFPEPARALVLGALGAQGPEDPVLASVLCHYLELGDELATAYLVTNEAVVRVQVRRDGAYQRTLVPISQVLRVDELSQGGQLTVVVEMEADRGVMSLVVVPVEGRFEGEGSVTRNGWLLAAQGPGAARLAEFTSALRRVLLNP